MVALMITQALAINVTELQKPELNKVVIKIRFENGSISDPKGKEGLTYLTSELINEIGTQNISKSEIDDMVYTMAIERNSFTDKEITTFTYQVHVDFLDQFYPVIRGLLLEPNFTTEDFERVKSNQLNYVDQLIRASSDEEYSKMALEDLLFRGTNYQHMTAGNTEGVSAITLEDVKEHFKNYFTRNNVSLGIAGNYSPDFLNKVVADLEQLPDVTPEIPEPATADMPDGIEVEIVSKENALGSAIYGGYPLDITRASDEFAALMVANSYIGEHRKSYGQLYQKIREQRSMNYGDYTYIEWYEKGGWFQLPLTGTPRHSNYFSLWIRPVQIKDQLVDQYPELEGINVGHAHFALRMALSQIDKLIQNGMSQEDFEVTRQFLRSYIKLYVQTPAKELGFLMDSKFYGRENYIREMDALLAQLTVDDVNAAIKKYLQVNNMYITIITDDSEAEPLAESLKSNMPSPMSYSNALKEILSPEILAEDEKVKEYQLNISEVTVVPDEETFELQ